MKNAHLIKAFETLMTRLDKPVTPISTERKGRGRLKQAYRMASGQTLMLRTNEKPALMVAHRKKKNGKVDPVDAPLAFEPYDYVAAIYRNSEHRDRAVVHLIPSNVAAPEMKKNQAAWINRNPKFKNNRLFVIRFDDAGEGVSWTQNRGYGTKWAQYRLGDVELSAVAPSERPLEETGELPAALLERHRQMIADALQVIPEAVEIKVHLVYQDKDGKTRSALR